MPWLRPAPTSRYIRPLGADLSVTARCVPRSWRGYKCTILLPYAGGGATTGALGAGVSVGGSAEDWGRSPGGASASGRAPAHPATRSPLAIQARRERILQNTVWGCGGHAPACAKDLPHPVEDGIEP